LVEGGYLFHMSYRLSNATNPARPVLQVTIRCEMNILFANSTSRMYLPHVTWRKGDSP
jgi:hypothetical protein